MEKNVEGGGGGGRGLGGGGDKSEGSSSSSSASTNQPRLFGHQEFSPGERQIVRELLQKKLGKEHLATRPGAAGSHYTYVESWKAIEIANQIFGFNGWSCSVVDIVPDYIEETRQGRYSVGVTAIVKVCLKDGTYHEDVGYGMSEHPKKGSAIEHAKKEAVSDARKRALRLYGNALGNCLYDKQHLTKLKSSKKGEAGFLEESPVNPYVSNSINGYSTTALSQMQPPAAPSAAAHNPHDLSAAKGFAPPTAYPQPPQLQNITSPYQPSQTGYGQSSPSSSTSSSTGINNKPYSFTSPQPQQQHGSYSQGPSFTQQQQQQQPSNSSVGSVSQSLPLKTTVDVQQPQQGGINSAPHFSPTIRTAPSQMNNSTNPYYSQQQGLPPLSQDSTDAHLLESLSADSQATPVPPYSRGKRGYEATATPLSQQQSQPISSTAPPGISTASGSGGYSNNNHSYSQPNNNYPSSSSSSFSQQQHHQGSSSGSPPASSAMGSNNSGGGKSFPPPSFGLRDITPPEKRLRT